MKEAKDNFSTQSDLYVKFRPEYPDALYEFIFKLKPHYVVAWDCGTGNGQVAAKLAERCHLVYASDISQKQLDNAIKKENIHYLHARAEATNLPDNSIDLVTVAQAIHWFDFDAFYREVYRITKAGAVVAVWCYNLPQISPEIDSILNDFYNNVLDGYWDIERKYIDENYTTIPFPFEELEEIPQLSITTNWTLEHLLGYLNSWSAVQHYIDKNGTSPVKDAELKFREVWPENKVLGVVFPIAMRVGTT
ncbi:class I SAM-dependent methyltransferase [Pontibacter sp. KCTC 32443]|uniref:class I SAM-dependent methyltransferase n=1 Tax=Pontibacter TaxID=323449 RepID=UPI00164DF6E8|nr:MULTISPECIES: class I SAM-dependent methyltransferase [Pontibacter]MBC5772474.1 class I SAM-dependent methyltransferase [Pontibacter sp. KCTC 32443]